MWEKMLMNMLPELLEKISPQIRSLLEELINTLKEKARTTSNPYDDAAVAFLAAVLGIPHKG